MVALRADFYGRFAAYPGLAELLGANHVLVGPMQASELRRVVELPAGRVGLRVEPELADALVDDVEGEPGALPLLSTALLELWQKRQDNALTLAAYRESGGVHGAVARLAEGTYARIPDERKPLVRAIMLRLVGEGEGDAPVRRRAPLAELDLERNEDVADVLATLADSRLVTVGEGSVEVAHEALLREWPRLREWIEEDAEGRRLRRHITQAATEWDAAGRDQGELYRGARLAAALDWTADHALDAQRARARVRHREPRGLRAGDEAGPAHEPAPSRRCSPGSRSCWPRPSRAGSSPSSSAARRATRRRPSSPSASARRRSSRRTSTVSLLLARQAVAIDDSPQTRGYLLAALLALAGGGRDHARRQRRQPPPRDRRQPRREDARGRRRRRRAALLRRPDVRADRRAAAGAGAAETRRVQPGRRDARWGSAGTTGRTSAWSTRARGSSSQRRRLGTSRADPRRVHAGRLAARRGGVRGRRRRAGSRSGTPPPCEPIGSPIEPAGFTGRCALPVVDGSQHRADARRPLARHRLGRGRARLVGSRQPQEDEDARDRRRAITRSRSARMGARAAIGLDDGIQLIDLRTGAVREASGRPRVEPDLAAVQPRRQDGRVDEPRRNGDPLGRRCGDSPRDAARPLGLRPAAGLQPRREDALHGELTTGRRSPGTSSGRPAARTAVHVHARPRALPIGRTRHPGRFSPDGRLIAVGLKERGIRLWTRGRSSPVGAPLLETGGEVTALAFSPDGRTLAAVTGAGMATLWDVDSRSLRVGTVPASAIAGGRREHQRGRDDARHGRREAA